MNGRYHVIRRNGDILKRGIQYHDAILFCNREDQAGCYGNGETPSMRIANKFIIWSPSAGKEI